MFINSSRIPLVNHTEHLTLTSTQNRTGKVTKSEVLTHRGLLLTFYQSTQEILSMLKNQRQE
jgi:hypothetical protein